VARAVDSAIDQYNDAITETVRKARDGGRDWYLFDTAGLLDRLAARRYIGDPLAHELIDVMQQHAGVKFYLGDGSTERTGPVRVDFGRLISRDTLISDPPRSLTSGVNLLGWIDETLDGVLDRMLF
jgi:hypothetical protein